MATIIAGEFATMEEAQSATTALQGANFAPDKVSVFMLNAPGQHAIHPLGGDEDADRGASHADSGAVKGAVIGGVVGLGAGAASLAVTEAGPVIAATAAAVGAYTGSLIGALNKTGDAESPQPVTETRHAGAMVAVNATESEAENSAIEILRAHGAKQVERAQGQWENGKWVDFDPRSAPHVVAADRANADSSAPGARQ